MSILSGLSHAYGNRAPRWPFILDGSSRLARGLVGAFVAIDGSTEMVDLTGNISPLVDANSSDVTSGIIGDINARGVQFSGDATNDRINLGSINSTSPLSLYGKTSASVLAWVRCDSIAGFPRIIDKSSSGGAASGWAVWSGASSGDGKLAFAVGGSAPSVESSSAFFSAGFSGLVGISVDDSTSARMYKNGVAVSTNSPNLASFPSTTTNAAIGNWNHSTDRMWSGVIYSVLVYDRALSEAEHVEAFSPDTRWLWAQEYGRRTYFIPEAAAPGSFKAAWATPTVTISA